MKLLHTSDWHVGRGARGRDRHDEHDKVLRHVVQIAREQDVDLVVVAGDQYDRPDPTPASERIVNRTLTELGEIAPTVVLAGNHDGARRAEAVRKVFGRWAVHTVGNYRPADKGGLLRIATAGGDVAVAALPWIPYRRALDVAQVLDPKLSAADYGLSYAELMVSAIADLTATMDDSTINIAAAHLSIMGAAMGGGERANHCTVTYHVPASAFPPILDYVALGHFHRPQIPQGNGPAIHYSGSPMPLDFAEDHDHSVNIVEIEPGLPPKTTRVPVEGYRRMVTLEGPADAIGEMADALTGEEWVRLRLTGEVPPGAVDQAKDLIGGRLITIDVVDRPRSRRRGPDATPRLGRPLDDLFTEFLAEQKITHAGIAATFKDLHEECVDASA
jgi:DNA repair protein SbcD/Mre11